jgi:hypothetical protein
MNETGFSYYKARIFKYAMGELLGHYPPNPILYFKNNNKKKCIP